MARIFHLDKERNHQSFPRKSIRCSRPHNPGLRPLRKRRSSTMGIHTQKNPKKNPHPPKKLPERPPAFDNRCTLDSSHAKIKTHTKNRTTNKNLREHRECWRKETTRAQRRKNVKKAKSKTGDVGKLAKWTQPVTIKHQGRKRLLGRTEKEKPKLPTKLVRKRDPRQPRFGVLQKLDGKISLQYNLYTIKAKYPRIIKMKGMQRAHYIQTRMFRTHCNKLRNEKPFGTTVLPYNPIYKH